MTWFCREISIPTDARGAEAGFVLRYQHLSSPEEWGAYEGPYFQNLRAYKDPIGQPPFGQAADAFEAMQIKYGRKCMGFMAMAAAWEGW